jgi:hypothetical protein
MSLELLFRVGRRWLALWEDSVATRHRRAVLRSDDFSGRGGAAGPRGGGITRR